MERKNRFYECLVEVGKLQGQGHDKIIETLIKDGRPWAKYRDQIKDATDLFAFAQMFHWTPQQVRDIDEDDKMIFQCLMKGYADAQKSQANSNNTNKGNFHPRGHR